MSLVNPFILKLQEDEEDKKKKILHDETIGGKDPFFADQTHPETAGHEADFPQLQEDEKPSPNLFKVHDMSLMRLFYNLNKR